MINQDNTERRIPYLLLWIFLVLALGIGMVAYLSFQNYQKRFRAGVESQLAAVARLKAGELEHWRTVCLEHGDIIARIEALSSLVSRAYISGADPESRRQLRNWLASYSRGTSYTQARLLDTRGNTLVSMPGGAYPLAVAVRQAIPEVLRSNRTTLVDFYRDDHDRRVYLTLLVPIRADAPGNRVQALLALRIDPETYLYPLINQWPTPSATAETLLVRREGKDALFLNELRFQKNTALNLKRPLQETGLPGVMAALDRQGIVEGTDYQGRAVVACLQAVSGSPWRLVARMDKTEIYSSLKERLWQLIGSVMLLLALAGGALALVWRQQRLLYYRRQVAVERERSWLHDIIKRSLNEIYVFDRATLRFIFANDGGMANLGYSMEELRGMTAFDIKPEFTEEHFRELITPLSTGEQERLIFETIHCRRNGTTYPVEVYLQLVETADDVVLLAVINDITVRKKAEKELMDKNAELERFTYTVSHDLKSPIITIKGFTGSLEKDLENGNYGRMAGDLKRVSAAADKMDDLLRDLLELSTIGRVIHTPEPVDMNLLVHDVLEQLAGSLKNNAITVTVQSDLPTVFCDRQRLAEVVQNLVENAIRYRGDRSDPQIRFGMREDEGKHIFFVQDNGIGIDEKYHHIIFGLFNKLDPKSNGTGIGLALVKRIVEVHGGNVWVESQGAGKGSTFCFTLAQQQ